MQASQVINLIIYFDIQVEVPGLSASIDSNSEINFNPGDNFLINIPSNNTGILLNHTFYTVESPFTFDSMNSPIFEPSVPVAHEFVVGSNLLSRGNGGNGGIGGNGTPGGLDSTGRTFFGNDGSNDTTILAAAPDSSYSVIGNGTDDSYIIGGEEHKGGDGGFGGTGGSGDYTVTLVLIRSTGGTTNQFFYQLGGNGGNGGQGANGSSPSI